MYKVLIIGISCLLLLTITFGLTYQESFEIFNNIASQLNTSGKVFLNSVGIKLDGSFKQSCLSGTMGEYLTGYLNPDGTMQKIDKASYLAEMLLPYGLYANDNVIYDFYISNNLYTIDVNSLYYSTNIFSRVRQLAYLSSDHAIRCYLDIYPNGDMSNPYRYTYYVILWESDGRKWTEYIVVDGDSSECYVNRQLLPFSLYGYNNNASDIIEKERPLSVPLVIMHERKFDYMCMRIDIYYQNSVRTIDYFDTIYKHFGASKFQK